VFFSPEDERLDATSEPLPWILIPIYDHGTTIEGVIDELAPHGLPCVIVDDGSGPATRAVLDRLARRCDWIVLERLEANTGKGAALRRGFRVARERGATHVIHLDADGQHEIADVPRFVDAIRRDPDALVLGKPIFDDSVPRARLASRQLSRGIVWLCTLSFAIDDPLCGFRAVPLVPTVEVLETEDLGDRMEFEPGLAVVLYWSGIPVRNLPTRVRYLPGGLSHFDSVRDTARMAKLYAHLLGRMIPRAGRLLSR